MNNLDVLLSVCVGIGLSAACGFRIFVPLLCLSAAGLWGHLPLTESFSWVATWPAFIAFAVATGIEIAGYYIPWVDNALDTIAAPVAVLAGTLVMASVTADMSPLWRWSLALIAGGGAAATSQLLTTKLRAISSVGTGGLGNPVLSTIELGISTLLSILAVLWPIVAVVLAIFALVFLWLAIRFFAKLVKRLFGRKEALA